LERYTPIPVVMPDVAYPVFISYSRRTSLDHASKLHAALGGEGGLAFLDTSDIALGSSFPAAIGEALLGARVVVVFCDATYFTRWYCLREFSLAVSPLRIGEASDVNQLAHIVVALGDHGGGLSELPPHLRITNWPPANELARLEELVRKALATNPRSIRERIGAQAASTEVAILVEESLVPGPQSLAAIPTFPVALPPSIGPRFVGRADDLWRLHFALSGISPAHTSAGLTGSIESMGGMGKTRLAIEYLHRFGPSLYPGGLFWINADASDQDLEIQLHGVLQALDPHAPSLPDCRESGLDVRDMLANSVRAVDKAALFVVDNVPDPPVDVPLKHPTFWCPALGHASVLITSRTHISVGTHGVSPLSIDPLALDSALLLLTEGLDRSALPDHEWRESCEWVGRLPLALELLNRTLKAGALLPSELPTMRRAPTTPQIDECMRILRPHIPEDSLRGITETFRLSFDSLPPSAQVVAVLLVELASAPIPLVLLQLLEKSVANSSGSQPAPPSGFAASRAALVTRSFVTPLRSGPTPLYGTIHRVVADFIQSLTPPTLRAKFLTIWCDALCGVFRAHHSDNPANWDLLDACAPHVDHLLRGVARLGVSDRGLSLGYHFGTFLLRRGQPRRAFELLPKVTAATEDLLGPTHEDTLSCKDSLAKVLIALGRTAQAGSILQNVASTLEGMHGPDDHRTLAAYASLGSALNEEGRCDEARYVVERSLERLRSVHGSTDKDLALVSSNLGLILLSLKDFEAAATVLGRTLPLLIESLTDRHPATQACMTNLGAAYRRTGRTEEATSMARRVYELRSAQFGDTHPLSLRALHNLAEAVAHSTGILEAIAIQRKAVEGHKQVFGELSAPTLQSQGQLGAMLAASGNLEEAEPLARDVAEGTERLLSGSHPHVAIAKKNYEQVLAARLRRDGRT
jgi:tetratricopeptide (TPR) repeat protein